MFRFLTIAILILGLAVNATAQDNQGWIAHYTAESGGFQTILRLINVDLETEHQVTITPFGSDGTQLDSLAQVVTLSGGQSLFLNRNDLSWDGEAVSHLFVDAPDSVRVSAAYQSNAEGAMSAEVPLRQQTATSARLVPVKGAAWFDGLVVTNPGQETANVVLSAHDAMGNTLQSTSVSVLGGGKWLGVISSIFDAGSSIDGYVQATSDFDVMFLALRGSLPGADASVLTEVAMDTYQAPIAKVTWSNQISRIVDRNCNACHIQNGIGPFPLGTYEDLTPYKDLVAHAVSEGSMPPWKASEDCLELSESRAMDPLEKAMMLDWLASGAEEGNSARALPEPPPLASQWGLGQPDMMLQYQEPYDFQPGPDDYRCFPIALNNAEEITIRAFDILPGNSEIVHHVLVFLEEDDRGQVLDEREAGPGYTCFGGPGTGGFRLLAGWAPGMDAQVFADGVGMTAPPNSTLIVQVHYHYSGRAGLDQSQVGLYIDETPREETLTYLPLVNTFFRIPPNAKAHHVTQTFTIPPGIDATLYTLAPHMHLLGKSIWVDMTLPDGEEICLIDVPVWDFNWQRFYALKEPMPLPTGARLTLNCIFDNSTENPNNPFNPPITVGWGEETSDEMALAFLGVTSNFVLGKKGLEQYLPTELTAPADLPAIDKTSAIRSAPRASCCSPEKDRPWCPSEINE